jgi:hypothetical protein
MGRFDKAKDTQRKQKTNNVRPGSSLNTSPSIAGGARFNYTGD